ncbi:MAG: DnaJ domain-containing protein [Bryobacteraceae bacterium]
MMNFYEEFGVSSDASASEIRQAYKALARVLHPDSQTDEKLRAVAACQMKRVHEVLNVLLDPGKRRAYDESLAAPYLTSAALHRTPHDAEPLVQPPEKFGVAQAVLRHWAWVLMGCMIFGSGFWFVTSRVPAATYYAPPAYLTAALPNRTAPASRPVERAAKHELGEHIAGAGLPSAAGVALPEKPIPAKPEPPGLQGGLLPAPVALPGALPTAPFAVRAPEVRAPAPSVPSIPRSSMAGEWFYAPGIEKPDPHLYPPVDIEFQLTEKDGTLSGQYRGRYKVPNAAVSQDVVFQVQGESPAGSSAALAWTSTDGARGEIDLNLSQPNLMKVTWWTTQLGSRPGLSSGAATLFRQLTP